MSAAKPNRVRRRVQQYSTREIDEIKQGVKGALVGLFNEMLSDDELRYIVWGWLFTPDDKPMELRHYADLTPANWYALKQWVGAYKDDYGNWVTREDFPLELSWVLVRATWAWEFVQNHPKIPLGNMVRLPHYNDLDELPGDEQIALPEPVQQQSPAEGYLVF